MKIQELSIKQFVMATDRDGEAKVTYRKVYQEVGAERYFITKKNGSKNYHMEVEKVEGDKNVNFIQI